MRAITTIVDDRKAIFDTLLEELEAERDRFSQGKNIRWDDFDIAKSEVPFFYGFGGASGSGSRGDGGQEEGEVVTQQ